MFGVCRRHQIEHIRTKVKRPQTNGKVERIFGTIKEKFNNYARGDLERFRMIYNHIRPHESLNYKCLANIYLDYKYWKGSLIQDDLDKKNKK